MQVFLERKEPISIADVTELTAMTTADIISTLQHLGECARGYLPSCVFLQSIAVPCCVLN